MFLVLLFALFISILLEATIVKLPLSFILLLCYGVLKRTDKVFVSAFFAGLMLDIFTIRTLGSTSIFFLLFFALVFLYQRKYEIISYPFVLVSSFSGTYLYLLIFSAKSSLLTAVVGSIFATLVFIIGKKLKRIE